MRAAFLTSSARGWSSDTSRGIRSWSSSSAAWTIGSAWKRRRMIPCSRTLAMATTVMPWWWAMKDRTIANAVPSGRRLRV